MNVRSVNVELGVTTEGVKHESRQGIRVAVVLGNEAVRQTYGGSGLGGRG